MFQELNVISITLRLVLAMLCGGLLGFDREQKRRPAGLRTYMLVCMGAALVMITSQYAVETVGEGDILRMGAQVISGIGFLGAGTIITGARQVKGLTTAAGLWAAACLGLAAGIGFYSGTLLGCGGILLVFTAFHCVEQRLSNLSHVMEVFAELEDEIVLGNLLRTARENYLKVSDIEFRKNRNGQAACMVFLCISWQGERRHDTIVSLLSMVPGVKSVEEC